MAIAQTSVELPSDPSSPSPESSATDSMDAFLAQSEQDNPSLEAECFAHLLECPSVATDKVASETNVVSQSNERINKPRAFADVKLQSAVAPDELAEANGPPELFPDSRNTKRKP